MREVGPCFIWVAAGGIAAGQNLLLVVGALGALGIEGVNPGEILSLPGSHLAIRPLGCIHHAVERHWNSTQHPLILDRISKW